MRVMVVGSGGREHALVWKLAQSRHVDRIYCAPGNAGIAALAECVPIKVGDIEGLAGFAEAQSIDLTVVGPEAPLAAGIVDRFEARGLRIFGPATDPARIEASKAFAKDLMLRYGIPTADYRACASADVAHAEIRAHFGAGREAQPRLVVKADGLAAGKGVIIAQNENEAHHAVDVIMGERVFGTAGDRIILEEFLDGPEISVMAFSDGEHVVPMPPAQDHKRALDGDQGPNTGGMGAYSPVPIATPEILAEANERVLKPAIAAIRDLGIPYKGVLFAGLILTASGLKALEFNCRFGDPETQVVLPLLDSDLVEVLYAATECRLDAVDVRWSSGASACVVAASGGYPDAYATGIPISGLSEATQVEGTAVFHAGTRTEGGACVTDGGRVLGITGMASDLKSAVARAYEAADRISFEGMHMRRDIARRAFITKAD